MTAQQLLQASARQELDAACLPPVPSSSSLPPQVYDPKTKRFSVDKQEMRGQLNSAWPVHTFPHVMVLPDGGVAGALCSSLGWWQCGRSTHQRRLWRRPCIRRRQSTNQP